MKLREKPNIKGKNYKIRITKRFYRIERYRIEDRKIKLKKEIEEPFAKSYL